MEITPKAVVRVNLFSGPGCGKSTTAARLFSDLKRRWGDKTDPQVELVMEYIKEWAWLKRIPRSWDQFYIFAQQLKREDVVLRHNHTNVITDSPVWMQLAYMKRGNAPFYKACQLAASEFDKGTDSFNIVLKRSVPYQSEGRYETSEQAVEMDNLVRSTLADHGVSWQEYDPVNDYDKLLGDVIKYIEGKHSCQRSCSTEKPLPVASSTESPMKSEGSVLARNLRWFLSAIIRRLRFM